MAAGVLDRVRDAGRLTALQRLALLDTPAEEAFDRLTRLATRVLRVPVALVTLVDEDRQFFKACMGLPEPWASWRETPLSHSFCQHVVASGDPLVIEDARGHPLVRDSLAIPELGVVAYAGIPLVSSEGHALGSFCVIDSEPRAWTEAEIEVLKDLAASVMTEIELRAVTREAQRQAQEAERASQRLAEQAKMLALLEERERIAMDLHDGVIQSLYAVALGLGTGACQEGAGPTWQPADEAIARINGVIQEIRNYIFDLRPTDLADRGLRRGLELLADELRINGLISPQLEVSADGEAALGPEAVTQLLAVAREATSNVIRHAGATAMTIRFGRDDGRFVLVLRDNGRGFDPRHPARPGANGLWNMAERARALGGRIVVDSRPGRGTEVRLELPAPDRPELSAEAAP